MKKWTALILTSVLMIAAAVIALRTDPVTWAGMVGMLCGIPLFGGVGFGIGWFLRGIRERQNLMYQPPPQQPQLPQIVMMPPNVASFGFGRHGTDVEMLPAGPRQFSVIGDDDT